jgi:hypothetical protein
MQAYEFDATIKNGVINIPEEYKEKIHSDVRVIILADKKTKSPKKDLFPDFALDTTGFVFNRDEANER